MYASIRRYEMNPGKADELKQRVNEGFLPLISDGPGFIAYYVLNAGDGVVASISIFESKAKAEESNQMAADWVKQNISSLIPTPPEITSGEVMVYKQS